MYKVTITVKCASWTGAEFAGFSPDSKLILFSYDIKNVWRHSYTAKYLVLDTVANKESKSLSNTNKKQRYTI